LINSPTALNGAPRCSLIERLPRGLAREKVTLQFSGGAALLAQAEGLLMGENVADGFFHSSSFTPNCSQISFLTRSSTPLMLGFSPNQLLWCRAGRIVPRQHTQYKLTTGQSGQWFCPPEAPH